MHTNLPPPRVRATAGRGRSGDHFGDHLGDRITHGADRPHALPSRRCTNPRLNRR